jgi:inhibitor of growth protein 3
VGCDSDDCPIEWFHYECMGLSEAPKGEWFCPACRPELWKDKPQLIRAATKA